MNRYILIIFSAILLPASSLRAQNPADALLSGRWWTGPKQEAQIAFFRNPGSSTLCGRLVWMKYPDRPDGQPALDEKNPDHALRDRPLLGLTLIDTLAYRGNGRWDTRRMYVPSRGMYVRSEFSLLPDGDLSLRVTKLGITMNKVFVRVPASL